MNLVVIQAPNKSAKQRTKPPAPPPPAKNPATPRVPARSTTNRFKASDLVLSLRSSPSSIAGSSPAYDDILDRATRGSSAASASPSIAPALAGFKCEVGCQTTEGWTPGYVNHHRSSSPVYINIPGFAAATAGLVLVENLKWSSTQACRSLAHDTDKMLSEQLLQESYAYSTDIGALASSPESNFSNVFQTEPPPGCPRPTPKRISTSPNFFLSDRTQPYACSEDGASTSSASSYSTMPSSISSPDISSRKPSFLMAHEKSAFHYNPAAVWNA